MGRWVVERVLHFDPRDFVHEGLAHFGFHLSDGSYYGIKHQDHYLGLVGSDGTVEFTVSPMPVLSHVPNIEAELEYPIYVDLLPDGDLIVSNFGNCRLYRVNRDKARATLMIDGHELGMTDMGNCVVDQAGSIWVNEVTGRRVWCFDGTGAPVLTLGDGRQGFQSDPTRFETVRFGNVYDMRRGADGRIYVLDSGNFAVRVIDVTAGVVETLAGNGSAGYDGDGADARAATFGSDRAARFDGPISLSLDDLGNVYVGDRYNNVVRMIDCRTGVITTVAGAVPADQARRNHSRVTDPLDLNLPQISSMDFGGGRLYVPTDLSDGSGDLAVLRLPSA